MSVWTYVHGQITVSAESHISVTKAIKEYFGNDEACPNVTQIMIHPKLIRHELSFSYSLENESAYLAWKRFADYVRDNLVVTDPRVGMDIVVELRWII